MTDETEVTIAEAAQRLATNEPRLRRLLQRPEFANCARQVSRQTKTGTRTGTAISVSVLPRLAEALREAKPEQKREHEHSEAFPLEVFRELSKGLVAEQAARIGDLQNTVQDLRAERDRLIAELEREREQKQALAFELETARAQLAIAAAPIEPKPSAAAVVTTEQETPRAPASAWWQFWRNKRTL
jgi:hypothetical protein